MNGLSNSADEVVECPLCMEPLEVDDLNFYPCTCGYQICRFCWHRIRTDENELCPACRKAYPENPADFKPLTQEEMIAFKSQKRQRDQQRKQKITENRKHLANVRVVQKNLVFVVGLPPRLADADILKKHEYFGKYGKIHKVVINPSTTYAGVQGPSASAYVTYVSNSDALRAIQSVNNINIDGRPIKTSLGTTKYCSHFMKNQQCPKSDCMYLHELGDPEASFTKEEMHQGKHQEYEKRLHDTLLASTGTGSCAASSSASCKVAEPGKTTNGGNSVTALSSMSSSSSSSSSYTTSIANSSSNVAVPGQQKDAWPSLSVSPVNNKDSSILNNKMKKDKIKPQDKLKNEKSAKAKSKTNATNNNTNGFNTGTKDITQSTKDAAAVTESGNGDQNQIVSDNKLKANRAKTDKAFSNRNSRDQNQEKHTLCPDEVVKLIDYIENLVTNTSEEKKNKSNNNGDFGNSAHSDNNADGADKNDSQRSLSSSSNASSTVSSNANSSICEDSCKQINVDNTSGKSSPNSDSSVDQQGDPCSSSKLTSIENDIDNKINCQVSNPNLLFENKNGKSAMDALTDSSEPRPIGAESDSNTVTDATAALSNLNLFDDHNSFFSSSSMASLHQSLLLKNKLEAEMRQNHVNSAISSHLPDLLNGIDGFQSNVANSDEWERAFKNVMMMRNNKQQEDQHQQLNHQQHQIQHQLHQEEYLRFQELQKRNGLVNNIGLSQINGLHNDFGNIANNIFDGSEVNRLSQATLLQQQQILQQQQQQQSLPAEHILGNNLFGNMSKFFDFHKNQQQQQMQQQFMLNGGTGGGANNGPFNDHLRLNSLLENNRINSQFLDQTNSFLAAQQQQLQKQRLKYDSPSMQTQNLPQQSGQPNQHTQQTQQQVQQNRISNQFSQNSSVDDDLGFDPFIETQKALAELMENEIVQQQNVSPPTGSSSVATKLLHHQQHQQQQQQQQIIDNMHRPKMPPPGFNHMNAFGFGVPRSSQSASKILPFMNGGNQVANNAPLPSGNWNSHLNAFQQQQSQPLNDAQMQQLNQSQGTGNHKAYGNNDWTSMDPAILSFRQFPFPQQPHLPHPSQQADFFLQNMAQQQNVPGFGGSQQQLHCGGITMPNGLMNTQQTSPAQVNANVQGMLEYLKNYQFI